MQLHHHVPTSGCCHAAGVWTCWCLRHFMVHSYWSVADRNHRGSNRQNYCEIVPWYLLQPVFDCKMVLSFIFVPVSLWGVFEVRLLTLLDLFGNWKTENIINCCYSKKKKVAHRWNDSAQQTFNVKVSISHWSIDPSIKCISFFPSLFVLLVKQVSVPCLSSISFITSIWTDKLKWLQSNLKPVVSHVLSLSLFLLSSNFVLCFSPSSPVSFLWFGSALSYNYFSSHSTELPLSPHFIQPFFFVSLTDVLLQSFSA